MVRDWMLGFLFASLFFWLGWTSCVAFVAIDTRKRWLAIHRMREDLELMKAQHDRWLHDEH
jgi:hypothetical protein